MQPSPFVEFDQSTEVLSHAQGILEKHCGVFLTLLNCCAVPIAIVTTDYLTVFANSAFSTLTGDTDTKWLGKQFGEAVRCSCLAEFCGKCGDLAPCAACGGLIALRRAVEGSFSPEECQLRVLRNGKSECLDLQVSAAPFSVTETEFIVMTLVDNSDGKRRSALERSFFMTF